MHNILPSWIKIQHIFYLADKNRSVIEILHLHNACFTYPEESYFQKKLEEIWDSIQAQDGYPILLAYLTIGWITVCDLIQTISTNI